MINNKVVSLVKDKEAEVEKSYVSIVFVDGTKTIDLCDSFGEAEELKGFIMIWVDTLDSPTRCYNKEHIRSIKVYKESELGVISDS